MSKKGSVEFEQALTQIFQIVLWVIAAAYFTSAATRFDYNLVIGLDQNWQNQVTQAIVNSPNCLAYEEFQTVRDFNEDGNLKEVWVESKVYPGKIDLTKFYDPNYQNCVRYNTLLNTIETLIEPDTCGQVYNYYSSSGSKDYSTPKTCPDRDFDGDGNKETLMCQGFYCVPACQDPANCNPGEFLTYEVVLKEFTQTGIKEHSYLSEDSRKLFFYNPSTEEGLLTSQEIESSVWGSKIFPQYLNCNSNFIKSIKTTTMPVKIINPMTDEETFGVIEIKMCLGRQGALISEVQSFIEFSG